MSINEENSKNDLLSNLQEELALKKSEAFGKVRKATRFSKGILLLVGAAIVGLAQLYQIPSAGDGSASTAQVWGFAGVILVAVGGLWSLVADDSAPDLAKAAEEAIEHARAREIEFTTKSARLKAERESLEKDTELIMDEIEWLSNMISAYSTMREFVENLFFNNNHVPFEPESHVQTLIDGAARLIHGLMEFGGGEYWTISVYKFVPDDGGKLVHIAGHKADRRDENTDHRSWGIGEGLAGHVFQIGREQIISDISDRDKAGWLNVPKPLQRPGDEKKYVSLAAVPVRIADQDTLWGVVAATSDDSDRFSLDEDGQGNYAVEGIRLISGMVALLVSGAYINVKDSSGKGSSANQNHRLKRPTKKRS